MRPLPPFFTAVAITLTLTLAACSGGTSTPSAKDAQPTAASQTASKEAAKPAAKVLESAYVNASDTAHKAFDFISKEAEKRSNGTLKINYHPGTLLTKEAEIIDAVKSGNIFMGCPVGAASSLFPEMGVFLVPFLVRDYEHAYKLWNGEVGKQLAELIENKYKVRVLYYFDFGFRHFWNTKRPINTPADLNGLKMRVQQGKVFADTVNALGASAVPMGWNEVIPAVQQGVVDGADLPVINIYLLKAYEVSKYASLTYHNYGPTMVVVNPDVWKGLSQEHKDILSQLAIEAQKMTREATESVDSLEGAKKLLEPTGMQVNAADLSGFRKIAEEKVWPQYKKEYPEMWDKIVGTK